MFKCGSGSRELKIPVGLLVDISVSGHTEAPQALYMGMVCCNVKDHTETYLFLHFYAI